MSVCCSCVCEGVGASFVVVVDNGGGGACPCVTCSQPDRSFRPFQVDHSLLSSHPIARYETMLLHACGRSFFVVSIEIRCLSFYRAKSVIAEYVVLSIGSAWLQIIACWCVCSCLYAFHCGPLSFLVVDCSYTIHDSKSPHLFIIVIISVYITFGGLVIGVGTVTVVVIRSCLYCPYLSKPPFST